MVLIAILRHGATTLRMRELTEVIGVDRRTERALEHAKVLFELATCLGNEACWIEAAADAEARGLPEDPFLEVGTVRMIMSSWGP